MGVMRRKYEVVGLEMMTLAMVASWSLGSGVQYSVGDSLWTIPPYPYYFSNWSSSHYFKIGDSLVFEFETGRYDVIQVSKIDYDLCTVWNPIRIFYGGPAIIQLTQPGVFYFLCNFSNYCDLGLRISVVVHRGTSKPYPPPPLPPSPAKSPAPTPLQLPTSPPALMPLIARQNSSSSSVAMRSNAVGLGYVFIVMSGFGLLLSFLV